ncbi:MAG: methyltransferase [Nitrospirota bacterium]
MGSSMQKAFDDCVTQWQAYARSPLGSIRRELTWVTLEKILTESKIKRVLDAGCGLAETAGLWLERDCHLFLCDYSPAMIKAAKEALLSRYPEKSKQLHFIEAPVLELPKRFDPGFFDLILCHTLLEYVDDSQNTLNFLADLLRQGGIFSCMVVNCFSESLRMAIRSQDPERAKAALEQKIFSAGLFQNINKRTFSIDEIKDMVKRAGLRSIGEFGLRIFSDFYPEHKLREQDFYNKVLELECQAMDKDPYRQLGRYIHVVGKKLKKRKQKGV